MGVAYFFAYSAYYLHIFLRIQRIFLRILRIFLVFCVQKGGVFIFCVFICVFFAHFVHILRMFLRILRIFLRILRISFRILYIVLRILCIFLRILRIFLRILRKIEGGVNILRILHTIAYFCAYSVCSLRILRISLRTLRIFLRILRISLRILRISLRILRIFLRILRISMRILHVSLRILRISMRISAYFYAYSAYSFEYSFSRLSKSCVLREFIVMVQCAWGRLSPQFSSSSSFAINWLQTIHRAIFSRGPPALIRTVFFNPGLPAVLEFLLSLWKVVLCRYFLALDIPIIWRHILCVGHMKYATYAQYAEYAEYAEYAYLT
jgi:hypothetical protein